MPKTTEQPTHNAMIFAASTDEPVDTAFAILPEYPSHYRRQTMKAEIISIGSEITSGQNLDTNCQWLSRRLAEMGIGVGFHTTVADDLNDNHSVFRTAIARA